MGTLALLFSCRSANDYEEARAACDLQSGVYIPLPFGEEGTYYRISAECATALGDSVGMSWDSFQYQPQAFGVTYLTPERFLSGMFVVISSNMGTVEDLTEDRNLAPTVLNELQRLSEELSIASDEPAGKLWYYHITSWIKSVSYTSNSSPQMSYNPATSELLVADLTSFNKDREENASPFEVSGDLIHESAHGYIKEHIECMDGSLSCDSNFSGVYGLQALWSYEWIKSNCKLIPSEDYYQAVERLQAVCQHVYSEEYYEPCDESAIVSYCG